MGEIERERSLRIKPPLRGNSGSTARERTRTVGADHKRNPNAAASMIDGDARGVGRYRQSGRGDAWQSQRRGAGFECGQQVPVFDVVAEGLEPDLRGIERNLRCAEQPPGVVDDAQSFKRRSVGQARRPHAQRCQGGNGTGQKGRGAVVRLCRRRDQKRIDAGRGQRDGADQARRAAADHRYFGGMRVFDTIHVFNQSLRAHPGSLDS